MLVLSRKLKQEILIGENIKITVLKAQEVRRRRPSRDEGGT